MTLEYEKVLEKWIKLYRIDNKPIAVNFRELGGDNFKSERLNHLLHPYPAKLLPQIPFFFVSAKYGASGKGFAVADPFCGTGTVLVEAAHQGHTVVGSDSNPLARLITKVKLAPIKDTKKVEASLKRVLKRAKSISKPFVPPVINVQDWYHPHTINELARLRAAIKEEPSSNIRNLLRVCLSVTAKKASMADPRISVPVKINPKRRSAYGPHYDQLNKHLKALKVGAAYKQFAEIVLRNAKRASTASKTIKASKVAVYPDAMTLSQELHKASVDLIVTSPPYAGAQKYVRASSLGLGWLDLAYDGQLRSLEKKTIGREHFSKDEVLQRPPPAPAARQMLGRIWKRYPLRAHIATTYLEEMALAMNSMNTILRQHGRAVLVVGANTVCGEYFDTPRYITELAVQSGFIVEAVLIDHITSRSLMTKRNSTASMITSESIICLRKSR